MNIVNDPILHLSSAQNSRFFGSDRQFEERGQTIESLKMENSILHGMLKVLGRELSDAKKALAHFIKENEPTPDHAMYVLHSIDECLECL